MESSALNVSTIMARLAEKSGRPRYAFQVLSLLSEAADQKGRAGPFVDRGGERLPIRTWLGTNLAGMTNNHYRRRRMRDRISTATGAVNPDQLAQVEEVVQQRATVASSANVSRAVSDLVQCGLVRRFYAGYATDHENKGGCRNAVYVVSPDALAALGRGTLLI